MKKIRPILLLLVVLGIGYMSWTKYQGTKFRYSGTLEADETDISPGVTSQIEDVAVKEGDMVKAGQLLVQLQCQEVRINSANVGTDYARAEKLYAAGSMPKANYDRAKYQAQNANLQLSFCDITSPIDAAVISVYRRKGEWARPGVNLLTIEDLAHPYAYIYMPLEERAKLKLGSKVKGYLAGDDSKVYNGTVSFLRPDAEFTPKNVQTREQRDRLVFGVKIAFENPDGALSPGLPIDVKIGD
jgi:HlyD family secretion protein